MESKMVLKWSSFDWYKLCLCYSRASADTVGEVTTCSEFQLQQWVAHAKTEYGSDVTLWDSATITSVGIVIGMIALLDSVP